MHVTHVKDPDLCAYQDPGSPRSLLLKKCAKNCKKIVSICYNYSPRNNIFCSLSCDYVSRATTQNCALRTSELTGLRALRTSKHVPKPYAPSILVVDDDLRALSLYRRILEQTGYFVYEAISARSALRAVNDSFFDLVITDLSFGEMLSASEMDGFEFVQAIRAELPRIKLLIVSGHITDEMQPIAARLGADATLEKCAVPKLLLPTVCRILLQNFNTAETVPQPSS